MTFFQAFILALVQGLTEFLPISSSGHLAVLPFILKFDKPSLFFDILVHMGTLLAVVFFLRVELWEIIQGI
jgi:undecaprenyl-diphosphatase